LICPGPFSAQTGARHRPRPPSKPPAARPLTKVRHEVLEGMRWKSPFDT
jgi:hypothetical protein